MKLTYDPKYNIAYISFKEKPDKVETICVNEELNIDISADGSVYGIELLNANEQLDIVKNKGLVLKNESTGEEVKLVA
ncbi:MAG TPA: DUF2283 domain-containing protein [Candidatus Wallbacteria bacterium]|nr:DUF2283 domain-containing protein [Candidatus Wallbacteria bacterium]